MPAFEIDRQTIDDLGIFTEAGSANSIFSFFDHVKTIGGQKKLMQMMGTPSPDINVLTSRRNCIRFFYDDPLIFDIDRRSLDFIDHYLGFGAKPFSTNYIDAALKGLNYKFNTDSNYYVVSQGLNDVIKLLRILWDIYKELSGKKCPVHINSIVNTLEEFLLKKSIEKIIFLDTDKDLNYFQIANYDTLFRKEELQGLKEVVNIVYELDVYIAVAKAAKMHNFCFPEYYTDKGAFVSIADLYHPAIKNAVKNSVLIEQEKNLMFLTGANMAGKSSFLKALSLCIYLAHIGFPVPAGSMQTNVFNGLITTINLSDNISNGYSHYYSEIKRVKETALKIVERNNLFIIFDELFRGTNVKDAYDASLATINALSAIKNSVFLISTHIVEIAAEITHLQNISFQYFIARIDNGKPVFEYKMREGVSSETLGFYIFKNEGILEILEKAANNINL
jgi:DNA mismatch repair protein MutS